MRHRKASISQPKAAILKPPIKILREHPISGVDLLPVGQHVRHLERAVDFVDVELDLVMTHWEAEQHLAAGPSQAPWNE